MLRNSIGFNSILLGIFALVTAGVVAITFQSTAEKIETSKLEAAKAMLYQILPAETHTNNLLQSNLPIAEEFQTLLGSTEGDAIYIAKNNNMPIAAIIPSKAPDGYSGDIKMLIGINKDGSIAGVRVTDHKETPGLGDGIDVKKGNWILSFNDKSLGDNLDAHPIQQNNKTITYDQLTGATITRTAVKQQVERTLEFFRDAQPLQSQTVDVE